MTRNFKVNKYIANVFKSSASAAGTMFTEKYMPQTSAIIKDFSRQATDIRDVLNQSRLTSSTGNRAMETGIMKNVADGFNNALEDLKTGNFNNTERADKAAAEAFGFNMDFENDLGNLDDIFGNNDDEGSIFAPEANLSMDAKLTNNTIAKSSSIMTATLSNAITTTGREVAKAEMQYDKKKTALNMNFLNQHFNHMNGNLSAINANLSTIVSFNNDVMKPFTSRAMQFFDEMTTNNKDILGFTRENMEMQRNLYSDFLAKKKEEGMSRGSSRYSKIFGFDGGFDVKEMFNAIQGNMSNSDAGMFGDLLGGDMGQMLVSNPIGMIMTSVLLPQLVNSKIGKSLTRLDKSIGSFAKAGNAKLGTLRNSGNPILSMIAEMFHIKPELKTGVDTSNYNRGAIPFDGETKKAIMNSADTLLRIESLLGGGPARTFNYKSGKYQTMDETKAKFKEEFDDKIVNSIGGSRSTMKNILNASNMKDKDKMIDEFDVIFKNLVKSDFFFTPNTKHNQMPNSKSISRKGFDTFKKAFLSMRNEDRIKFQSDIANSRDTNSGILNDIDKNLDSYGYASMFNGAHSKDTKSIFSSINDTTNRILLQIRDVLVRGINVGGTSNISYDDIFSNHSESAQSIARRVIKPTGIRKGSGNRFANGYGGRFDSSSTYAGEDWEHERYNSLANNGIMNKLGGGFEAASNYAVQKMHDTLYGKNAVAKAKGQNVQDAEEISVDPNSWKAKMKDSMKRGSEWVKENFTYEKMKASLPKFKTAGKFSLASMLGGLVLGNPLIGILGSIGSFTMASDTAKTILFGKLGEDGERDGGMISKKIQALFKKSFGKMSLGALGGLGLGGALFGSLGLAAPVIGASLGMAFSFDKVKKTMFGEVDSETGDNKGGVFNGKFVNFMKKYGKGMFGGLLAGGLLGQLMVPSLGMFGGLAPFMLGSMGSGLSFAISSGKASNWLFGQKDENGKEISKGVINEKLVGIFKKFSPKGMTGLFTGGLLSSLFTSFGPTGIILSSLFSSAIGIGLETDKFKNWFFGEKNEDGKREGGLKGKMSDWFENNITSFFMGTKGKYGSRYSDGLFSGVTDWFYGGYNPVTKKRENGMTSKMANWFESNITSFFFGTKDAEENRKGGLFGDIKANVKSWWIDSIKNPFKEALSPLKSIFNEMKVNMTEMFKSGWGTVTDTINTVFEKSVGKPLGELIQDKVTNPLKNMITKIVMGVGKVLGSILSAPIKGLNFFAKSILGNKDGDKVSKDQKDLDETIESMDEQAKREKKGFSFSFNFDKIGQTVRDGFNGFNIFSKFGSMFKGKDGKASTTGGISGEWFTMFGNNESKTPGSEPTGGKGAGESIFNKAMAFLKNKVPDKSILTRMKNETASAYRRRIVSLYKRYQTEGSTIFTSAASDDSGDNSEDPEGSRGGSFLDRLKGGLKNFGNNFSFRTSTKTVTETMSENISKMAEAADEAMKDAQEKKKKNKHSFGSVFRWRGIKSLTFDSTPTELKQGTVDMFHEYIPQMTSNIFEIKKEIHGQLDGVGYNLETITNILRTHIGQPDKDAKEYGGRGNKKYRGVYGMIREFVMRPIDFIGGIAKRLNPFTLMGKLFDLPIKGVKAFLEGFKNIFKLPEMIVGGLKGLGSGIALSLKLAIGGIGNILTDSIKLLGTTLNVGIEAMGGILNTGFKTLDSSISVLGNVFSTGIQALGPMMSLAVNGGLEGMKLLGKGGKYLVESGGKAVNYMLNAGMSLFGKGIDTLKQFNPLLHHTFKVKVEGGTLDNVDVVNLVKAVGSVGKEAMENSGAKMPNDQKFKNIKDIAEEDDNREKEQSGVLKKLSEYLGLKAKMDMAGGILSALMNGIKSLGSTVSTALGAGGLGMGLKAILAGTAATKVAGAASGAVGGIGNFVKGMLGMSATGKAGGIGSAMGPLAILKHLWDGEYGDAASDTARFAMKDSKISTNILVKIFQHPSVLKLIGGEKTLKALTPLFMKLGKQYGDRMAKNIARKAAVNGGRALADGIAAGTAVAGVGVLLKLGIIAYDLVTGMSSANKLFMIPSNESPSLVMRISAGIYKVLSNLIWGMDGIMDREGSRAWLLNTIFNSLSSEIEKQRMAEMDAQMRSDYEKHKEETGEDISFEDYSNKMNQGIIGKSMDMVKGAWKSYKGLWQKAYDGVKNFDLAETIGKGANKAKWMYMDAKEYFSNMGASIKDGFSSAYTKVVEWFSGPSFIEKMKEGIKSGFTSAVEGTKEAIMSIPQKLENVWDAVTSLPEKLVAFLKGLDPREYIKDKYNAAKDKVTGFFGNFFNNVKESYNEEEIAQRQKRGLRTTDYLTSNFEPRTPDFYNGGIQTGFGKSLAKFHKPIFGMGDVKFVSQLDSKYSGIDMTVPGDTNKVSFKDVGCGPATLSMALSKLNISADPKELAEIAVKGQYKLTNDGTHIKFFTDLAKEKGVPSKVLYKNDKDKILNSIRNGVPVILLGTRKSESQDSPFGPTPHYVLACGCDKIHVKIYDPLQKEPKDYKISKVLEDVTCAIVFGDKTVDTADKSKSGIMGLLDKLSTYFEKLVGGVLQSSSSGGEQLTASNGMSLDGIDFSKLPTNTIRFTGNEASNKRAQYAASIIVPKARAAGIDPTLAMAQWAHESAWGSRAPGNSYFGIKASGRSKSSNSFTTHEYINGQKVVRNESFAGYDSLEDSVDGYLDLITRRYSAVKTHGANGLLKQYNNFGSYATDPEYVPKIVAIQDQLRRAMKTANVEGFTGAGRLKSLSIDPNKILNKFGASDNSINKVVDAISGKNTSLKQLDSLIGAPDKIVRNVTGKVNSTVAKATSIGDQLTRLPENALNKLHSDATNKINSTIKTATDIPNNLMNKLETDVINKTVGAVTSSVNDLVSKPMAQLEKLTSGDLINNVASAATGALGAGGVSSQEVVSRLDTIISLLSQLVGNTGSLKMTEGESRGKKLKSAMGVPVDNATSHSLETDRMINALVKRRYT